MKPDRTSLVARLATVLALAVLCVASLLRSLPETGLRLTVRLDTTDHLEVRAHAAGHRVRLLLRR